MALLIDADVIIQAERKAFDFDAWLRANPGDWETAETFLSGFDSEMSESGIGTISEIFDAEPPFSPRGCIAQAWSVAEVLRCWVKTA